MPQIYVKLKETKDHIESENRLVMNNLKEECKMKQGEEAFLVTPFKSSDLIAITVYPFKEEYMEVIPEDAKYGNYRIGCLESGQFWVKYFGRSDDNDGGLRQRVSDHLSKGKSMNHKERLYDESYYFWFSIAANTIDAFKQECKDYHTFIDLDDGHFVDNENHPARPRGLKCPICKE